MKSNAAFPAGDDLLFPKRGIPYLLRLFLSLLSIALSITSSAVAAPPAIRPGSWTLAILPDTQYYALKYPEIFFAQTRFLAEQKASLNLVFVLHEGDVTQNNQPGEWLVASRAFKLLEDAGVPYSLLPGNHDYAPDGSRRSSCLMAEYFPVSRLSAQKTFGGVYSGEPESPHNSYSIFHAGGKDWLVLALEFGPRDAVLQWADGILKTYPKHQAIVVTHAYLYWDHTRLDWAAKGKSQKDNPHDYPFAKQPGGANDGQQIWEKLQENPNLQFIFSGHNYNREADDGFGYRADQAKHGNVVHQILANYQYFRGRNCGDGYLRLLEFQADGRTVHVRTYSPFLDKSLTDEENDFLLTLTFAEQASNGGKIEPNASQKRTGRIRHSSRFPMTDSDICKENYRWYEVCL